MQLVLPRQEIESSEDAEEGHNKEEEDTHQEEAQEGNSRPTYYCC